MLVRETPRFRWEGRVPRSTGAEEAAPREETVRGQGVWRPGEAEQTPAAKDRIWGTGPAKGVGHPAELGQVARSIQLMPCSFYKEDSVPFY